ncbi:DOMON-like domain-containing protein [Altererythrobacter arenosus]|uniref:DOMON-like domain-containing protein n=1 Tax=Altererythrobacter arenosus TaxID=3032592 RepID=A0ABY8FS26_9SPHN|nr:DOMON-like domain-containing protein [Altererythrobacter sp. CAU 1644]WFL77020.1 DOMON-like domain-containing protein [Altererythrobacter sp. CAU 1644]
MQAHRLIPHPAHPPLAVTAIEARIHDDDANWLRLRWKVEGAQKLVLPRIGSKTRADGLWRTTCFELFLQPEGGAGYSEWNLSPSRRWNAYDFVEYREGMAERVVRRAPDSQVHPGSSFTIFYAAIPRSELPDAPCRMSISAVIEEEGGRISYWAIQHPNDEKPDFHDPACFVAGLAAPHAS